MRSFKDEWERPDLYQNSQTQTYVLILYTSINGLCVHKHVGYFFSLETLFLKSGISANSGSLFALNPQ